MSERVFTISTTAGAKTIDRLCAIQNGHGRNGHHHAMPTEKRYAHIVGWGKYVPEKVMTNNDIAKIVDVRRPHLQFARPVVHERLRTHHQRLLDLALVEQQPQRENRLTRFAKPHFVG